jgi:hypothetical protein
MTNPYRAMCEQLMELVEGKRYDGSAVVARARALLDQPEPPELTDEKLLSLVAEVFGYVFLDGGIGGGESEFLAYARAADRARYGRPTPQPEPAPVPVSERLPRPEDCTAQGRCWVFYRFFGFATWALEKPLGQDGKHTGYTHWLPSNALPTPETAND